MKLQTMFYVFILSVILCSCQQYNYSDTAGKTSSIQSNDRTNDSSKAKTSVTIQTKVIAHRGFWNTPSSAENSIRSLIKADSIGCYGSEFDVWITKDGTVVVHHDPSIGSKEIQNSLFDDIKDMTIGNGEKIPTLASYLSAVKKLKVKLICEIKPHSDISRSYACVDSTLNLVNRYGLHSRMTYISFSLDACKRIKQTLNDSTEVYYLGGDLSPTAINDIGLSGIDYFSSIINSHLNYIDESHNLGLKVNVWTVDDSSEMQLLRDHHVDFITTNNPLSLQKIIGNSSTNIEPVYK